MSSRCFRLSRSWIQKLLLMQQDAFPFGAGDMWQHSAGAVAAFALQVPYAFQLIRIKGVTEQLICERMFSETDKRRNPHKI